MAKLIDISGQTFGRLTAVKKQTRAGMRCKNTYWLCQCECGRYLLVRRDNLLSGRSSQCSRCRENAGGVESCFVEVQENVH